ncbi:hypothetical protein HHI36_003528 [Cryptolaemus montrouzieri]|uniref:Protein phosphatase 1 regulatory subunit 42 n=1 Tax=Cryptolaemus montrouzieri TaxID=559131 RepID=A0ABD2PEM8_9CUCU
MKVLKNLPDKPKIPRLKPKVSRNLNVITHIYFDHKNLKKIPNLDLSGVCVFYLHNNAISKIENLQSSKLSSLYLQCNEIAKIENLEGVPQIKKLYLGNNEISVVEGIAHLTYLEELHIGKQRMSLGTSLCFDPRSVNSIAKSLQVLDISDNGIESLSSLAPLRHLRTVCASNNKLDDLDELCQLLKSWFYLRDAWFAGNPISGRHRYREDIIASTYCLDNLDDKAISAATRNFIKRFENEKLRKSSRPSVNLADTHPELPRNYPPPLQKAVSASLIQKRMHILGPLDIEMKSRPPQIHRPKPVLKKKITKTEINTIGIDHFPGSFSYKIRPST